MARLGAVIKFNPNPLSAEGRIVRHINVNERRLALHAYLREQELISYPCRVILNGHQLTPARLESSMLLDGDTVEVVAQAAEPVTATIAAVLVEVGIDVAIANTIASIVVTVAVNLAVSAIIRSISGGGNSGPEPRKIDKAVDGYGLVGGGNQYRPGQPVPLVMGMHRIFPDYSNWWTVDYIEDTAAEVVTQVQGGQPYFPQAIPAAFISTNPLSNGWFLLEPPGNQLLNLLGAPIQGDPNVAGSTVYVVDNQSASLATASTGSTTFPHRFIVRYVASGSVGVPVLVNEIDAYFNQLAIDWGGRNPGWQPYLLNTAYPYYGGAVVKTPILTQRFTAIFNYGLGDLFYQDHFIGQNPITNYSSVAVTNVNKTSTTGSLPNWRYAPLVNAGPQREFPDNVESVDGGPLKQNSAVVDSGYIVRRGTRVNAVRIELDIAGRLGKLQNGDYAEATADISIEYRLVAGSFTPAPVSVYSARNGTVSQQFRRTLGWDVPPGEYEVRIRKLTQDPTAAGDMCDLAVERVKFIATATPAKYVAQNRIGVQVLATEQLNGSLDRWSSLASARTWVYLGAAYDGSAPGSNAFWIWTGTANPAWWYLYFGAGGWLNSTLPATHPTASQGWGVGQNVGNTSLLFGAGLNWDEINIGEIIAWAQWCRVNNLEQFGGVVDTLRPVDSVLDDIARCGRAYKTRGSGKLGVVYFDKDDPVTSVVTMGNVVAGSFGVSYRSALEVDEIVVGFNDAAKTYGSAQVTALVPGAATNIRQGNVTLWGITDRARAQREANLVASDQRYHTRTVSWEMDEDGYRIRRGDVVACAHDLTSWGYSGRVKSFELAGALVSRIELGRDIEVSTNPSEPFYVMLRLPDGTLRTVQTAPPALGDTHLTLTGVGGLPAALAPAYAAPGLVNGASAWADSVPEDYVWLASPNLTPGKRLRVLSVAPAGGGRYRFTATDEVREYYLTEYAAQAYPALEGAGVLPAAARNVGVEWRGGEAWLVWELEHAAAAEVVLSTALAGTISTGAVRAGTELRIPNAVRGMSITATVTPDSVLSSAGSILVGTYFGAV